jgi:hypothetical protein
VLTKLVLGALDALNRGVALLKVAGLAAHPDRVTKKT